MQRLTDDIKTFIVTHLAMYDSPQQVASAVKEEFGLELDRQTVRFYDPTTSNPVKPGKRWIDLFEATREKFIDVVGKIPISIRAVRLRRLDRMALQLEKNRNMLGAAQLMKQAAEDIGGMYTNRRELTGRNGEPLVPSMTGDDRRARAIDILAEARRRSELAKGDAAAASSRQTV